MTVNLVLEQYEKVIQKVFPVIHKIFPLEQYEKVIKYSRIYNSNKPLTGLQLATADSASAMMQAC